MSDTDVIDSVWPLPRTAVQDDELAAEIADARGAGPWLSVNFISSLDGAGTHDGKSGGLGGPADKRLFDLLRRPSDAILVGAGTVRAEGYGPMVLDAAAVEWRRSAGFTDQPVFAIVSGRLDLDAHSPVFTDSPVRPVVVTIDSAPLDRRNALARVADVIVAGDTELDAAAAIAQLTAHGLPRVHCEGGPSLFGTLLAADLVDELSLTLSPRLEGGSAGRIVTGDLPVPRELAVAGILKSEDMLLLRYLRKGVLRAP